MSINLENYSAKELAALIAQASQRQKKLKKRKPAADVRKRINTIAREAGYTIAELFGGAATTNVKPASAAKKTRKSSTAGTKVAPKFRNPDKPSETWAARGKYPRWLAAEIAKGRKLEEFAIK